MDDFPSSFFLPVPAGDGTCQLILVPVVWRRAHCPGNAFQEPQVGFCVKQRRIGGGARLTVRPLDVSIFNLNTADLKLVRLQQDWASEAKAGGGVVFEQFQIQPIQGPP